MIQNELGTINKSNEVKNYLGIPNFAPFMDSKQDFFTLKPICFIQENINGRK